MNISHKIWFHKQIQVPVGKSQLWINFFLKVKNPTSKKKIEEIPFLFGLKNEPFSNKREIPAAAVQLPANLEQRLCQWFSTVFLQSQDLHFWKYLHGFQLQIPKQLRYGLLWTFVMHTQTHRHTDRNLSIFIKIHTPHRMSSNEIYAFDFLISRHLRGLQVSSWAFFNSPILIDFENIHFVIIWRNLYPQAKIRQGSHFEI